MLKNVLLIGSDDQTEKELQLVLEFIEYGSLIHHKIDDWQDKVNPGEVDLVIIESTNDSKLTGSVINQARNYFVKSIPILLYKDKEQDAISTTVFTQLTAYIDYPFRHQQLHHALHLAEQYRLDQAGKSTNFLFRSLVGGSDSIEEVRRLIEQVAGSEANVLIMGESGTGKEVIARNVHYYSKRRNKPFVPINCGAIPPDLLESELFGHEKGAFTGAISMRQGRFEMAQGGTLFLDEIGDMPLAMQVKLLRVIQERVFERVGSNKSIAADVRIVAATHRQLEDEIREGRFREDLYYRLNVFPIEVPPLRERIEDIPLLMTELITRMEYEDRGLVRITPMAVEALKQHRWPGNVRELSNLIERLIIMFPNGVVDVRDLPLRYREGVDVEELVVPGPEESFFIDSPAITPLSQRLPKEGLDLKEHMVNLESLLIQQALDESSGVVAHAAKRLNMRRTTLVEKMRKLGLQRTEKAS